MRVRASKRFRRSSTDGRCTLICGPCRWGDVFGDSEGDEIGDESGDVRGDILRFLVNTSGGGGGGRDGITGRIRPGDGDLVFGVEDRDVEGSRLKFDRTAGTIVDGCIKEGVTGTWRPGLRARSRIFSDGGTDGSGGAEIGVTHGEVDTAEVLLAGSGGVATRGERFVGSGSGCVSELDENANPSDGSTGEVFGRFITLATRRAVP
jgi:hypothetical protein